MEQRKQSVEELSGEEAKKYSELSPGQAGKVINAAIMNHPHDSTVFREFINSVSMKEQFMLQLMKTIEPQSVSFFNNISGICETRKKEAEEERQMQAAEEHQVLTEEDREEIRNLESSIAEQQKQLEYLRKRMSKSVS
jgi:hypothetical protein